MKRTHAFLALIGFATASHAQSPVLQWAGSISNVAFIQSAACNDVDVAADGSVYVNGVNGNTGFSEGASVIENEVINGPFLARYDASGELVWVRPGGWAITTVGSNDIYVTGDFRGTRSFGSTTFTADSVDAFLARYDANGNVIWARQMGGATRDKGFDVAVDASGQVHVAGFFTGSATFGSTTLVATRDSTGFIATYDANGNFIRAFIAGGVDNLAYNAGFSVNLDCDALGRTYLFGTFDGTASFNGVNLTSAGTNAMVLARFESNGTCTWAEQMGGSRNLVWGDGLAVSSTGNVYVLGDVQGDGDFGGTIINNPFVGAIGVLALYDPNGDPIWAQRVVDSNSPESFYSIALTSTGNAVIAGHSLGFTVTIGTTTISLPGPYERPAFLAEFDATGTCQWAERLSTADRPRIAMDPAGGLYLAGSEQFHAGGTNPTVFDLDTGTPMDGSIGGEYDGYLAHYNAVHDFQWIRLMGSTPNSSDSGNGIVTDGAGNVYTTGYFSRSAILCEDTLKRFTSWNCIYLSKRDANGDCAWISSVCTEGTSSASAIARDANGDLYIAGSFSGTADFGVDQLVSANANDVFLAKYDANGNNLWARNIGGPGYAYAVAVNASGAVAVAGTCSGTATIGTTTFTGIGNADGYLARYDASGNFIWARSMGGADFDNLTGLAMDVAGNAYVSGSFTTSATFGTIPISGTGTSDMFLAKYDDNGDAVWAQSMEGTGSKTGSALAIDGAGNIIATGSYSGSIDLGTVTLASGPGNWNIFLAGYSPAGANLWAQEIPTVGYTQSSAIAVRPSGDIVVAGYLYGTATIGGNTLTNVGDYGDVLLLGFDSNGQPLWSGHWGGGLEDLAAAHGVAADADFVHATGYFGTDNFDVSSFGGSIDFTAGTLDTTLYAPNGLDAFVVKYAIDESVSVAEASTEAQHLVLSPNPVDRHFTLTGATPFDARTRVVVRDALGREMKAPFTIQQGRIEVDAAALTPGVYTLTLYIASAPITSRFEKQ
jgi:hypothetical protein